MTREEKIQLANDEFRKEPVFPELLAKAGGTEPSYNGIVGDSCRCLACNMRRQSLGIAALMDYDKGVRLEESQENVRLGYGGNVPAWATADFAHKFFNNAPQLLEESVPLDLYKSWVPEAPNPVYYAKAVKAVADVFGEDSPQMKELREAHALSSKPGKTPAEMALAIEKVSNLLQTIELARATPTYQH